MRADAVGGWPRLAAVWCSAYGAANVWWLANPGSPFAPPEEVFSPGRWMAVALAFSAAVACSLIAAGAGQRRPAPARWTLVGVAWVAGAGLILYSYMLAISVATLLFGEVDDWGSLLARAAGATAGALTLVCAVAEQRRVRRACPHCARVHGRSPERRTDPAPWWARLAAYVAIAGCSVRVAALILDSVTAHRPPFALGTPFAVFVVLLILAGTLLPLALVHRFGRIWPRWVVPLAGRDVPRWLVLGPAWFVGAGLAGYFGVAGMAAWLLGEGNLAQAPVWRVSMEMFGYTAWGLGLLVAAVSYYGLTRPACPLPNSPYRVPMPLA
ncbi:hypothetical protein [Nonomuraea jiangxiensis]|uniref:Uncharacterized protein n=1 Tax=Nonomuraea jiangxiensis TaxID=633440 RepID=A0A1G9MIY1_9ACTN|nr:hypothetical protein [Nonomuraea jiangxiensis]SDL74230.1 hypothetical protein SAMN05421869_13029 [Nonomuraea jiangxiensis]